MTDQPTTPAAYADVVARVISSGPRPADCPAGNADNPVASGDAADGADRRERYAKAIVTGGGCVDLAAATTAVLAVRDDELAQARAERDQLAETPSDVRAVSSAGPAPAADRAALRQPAYDAVFAYIRQQPRDRVPTTIVDRNAMIWRAVHAALDAVLPAPVDRAAVLLEAADRIDRTDLPQDFVDMFDNGARWATSELRRLAGEAQQDETQAQPPHHRWSVETRDAVADQWAPGTPITDRDKAVERYEHVTKNWPTWKDGTPVQRRLVRATTTYTVEQGAVARPGQPETDGETDRA